MNVPGETIPRAGLFQRTSASNPDELAVHLRLRLVMQHELAARQRRTQFELQRAPFVQPRVHRDIEEAGLAATFGLGAIERRVRVGDQRRRVGAVGRDRSRCRC